MTIKNYSNERIIKGEHSIFLAGPTPRSDEVESWRDEAIEILEELGFDGVVYIPERANKDRNYELTNQYWWERIALHYADVIVFWIPREMKKMPGLTTNNELGTWLAKNQNKIIYARPDSAEKKKYNDLHVYVETMNQPITDLKSALTKAVEESYNKKREQDIDTYDLVRINKTINDFPEIMELIGEVQFTPESYGTKSNKKTYGQILFPNNNPNDLKEFDRTILSVLLYYYIKDNAYLKFIDQQKEDSLLTQTEYNNIREFFLKNFDTEEKERLLLYYIVINDLGKSQNIINKLKEKGIETVDHDLLLNYLLKFGMLPTLNTFDKKYQEALTNTLNYGINVGQYIQGEGVDYSYNEVLNLNTFEKALMMAEAMLDIGGVLGHINNQNGSVILNQPTIGNILTASKIISECLEPEKLYGKFLQEKANKMSIQGENQKLNKAITRICLMMRLFKKEDIKIVEKEFKN